MPDTTKKQRGNIDNLKPFKKGQSGNPKGRPKKDKCIPEILRRITAENDKSGVTKLNLILNNVVNEAIKGDTWSIQFIADRMEGKPAQVIQQTIEELPSGFTTERI